jgi:hypothetical protein
LFWGDSGYSGFRGVDWYTLQIPYN